VTRAQLADLEAGGDGTPKDVASAETDLEKDIDLVIQRLGLDPSLFKNWGGWLSLDAEEKTKRMKLIQQIYVEVRKLGHAHEELYG